MPVGRGLPNLGNLGNRGNLGNCRLPCGVYFQFFGTRTVPTPVPTFPAASVH
jgi:hypothetical protein